MHQSIFKIFAFVSAFAAFSSVAQDTLDLDEITIQRNRSVLKKMGLYDGPMEEDYNVRGYTQLSIFEGSLADFWTSEGQDCVSGKLSEGANSNNLRLKWNKDQDGCDWVGFGLGWDGWAGKDMAYVIDTLALELTVRSVDQPFTNLPWAFCFEDYSGGQAWLGYNLSFLKAEAITTEWTKVRVPLQLFPFEANDVDATNIKQLLIQTFAAGEIEIQEIKLVPFSGKMKKEFIATEEKAPINIDGSLSDWQNDFVEIASGQTFSAHYSADSIYFAFNIKDATPRQNTQKGRDLWQGDAVEIAFSTNPDADPKRTFLLLSDQHIGINCGPNPYVWDWKRDSEIATANQKITATNNGYIVEVAIPTNAFRQFYPKSGMELDLEIAVDLGTNTGRDKQLRWNSGADTGFNESPSKWGEFILE